MGKAFDAINEYLSDNDIYDTLNPMEKKILAKATNSIDFQVYLISAVETLDLAGVATSDTFNTVAEILIKNWDFVEQRRVAGRE